MQKKNQVKKMTAAALLTALGLVIPLFSPAKIVLGPASFTLASHLPIFLSMFISPTAALCVSLGTAFGFLVGPFHFVIAMRAASHVVFAVLGAWVLQKRPQILASTTQSIAFALVASVIHALGEIAVVSAFYFSGAMSGQFYENGFTYSVLGLVGAGTLIHSMVDFTLALLVFKALLKQKSASALFLNPKAAEPAKL